MNTKIVVSIIIMVVIIIAAVGAYLALSGEEEQGKPSAPSTVIYAFHTEMTGLDPSTEFSNSALLLPDIYEDLTKYVDGDVKPWLATSWESNVEGTVWTFHLREGVKFHSGNPFTAKDVKWSVERTIRMGLGGAFLWDSVEEIKVIDDYTVEFHLKYPANLPLIATAICSTYIMDSKMLSGIGNDTEITKYFNVGHDAGTGPYYLSSFDAKTEVVMKKFEDYWGGWTDDQFDIAIVKIVPDPSLREQMVMGNEIQITTFLPLDDIPILENNPNVDIVESPSFLEIYGMFNTLKEPLNNKLVRQALAYATPYEDIIEYVLNGYGEIPTCPIPKGMPGHFEDLPTYHYDMARARELLNESGYSGGFHLLLTYTAGDDAERKTAELLKSSWSKLGVDLEIRAMNWEQQWSFATSDPQNAQDVLVYNWWPTYPSPYDFLVNMFHSADPPFLNLAYYNNSEFDRLIDQAILLEGTNMQQALQLYHQAEEILMEDCPALFLYSPNDVYAVSNTISGFKSNPSYPNVVFFYELRKIS
ncbi:MAG: ABC transporter substrate-binding protein [Thermoplasmata archaeon]|nr:ABC transporter substrate-binding protein [Thermoplasmata archaeon]